MGKHKRREPIAPGNIGDPPPWFDEEHLAEWNYYITNAPLRILRAADRDLLICYVVALVIHRKAAIAMQNENVTILHRGKRMANPNIAILVKQALVMIRSAGDLGFSPVGRARLATNGRGTPSYDSQSSDPSHHTNATQDSRDEFEKHMGDRPN